MVQLLNTLAGITFTSDTVTSPHLKYINILWCACLFTSKSENNLFLSEIATACALALYLTYIEWLTAITANRAIIYEALGSAQRLTECF